MTAMNLDQDVIDVEEDLENSQQRLKTDLVRIENMKTVKINYLYLPVLTIDNISGS